MLNIPKVLWLNTIVPYLRGTSVVMLSHLTINVALQFYV